MAKIAIFGLKCQKIVFLTRKQRFHLKSLRGARGGDFLRISLIFFRIARIFFEKIVIFGCHYLAMYGFPRTEIALSE